MSLVGLKLYVVGCSRSIDFLVRTIDQCEFENQGTLIYVVNNADKRGLFDDIEEIRVMKDVRNTIAHEYVEDDLVDIFEDALLYSEKLISIINNTLGYIGRYV